MSIRISSPQILRSQILLPASKSISNRALIINYLSKGSQDGAEYAVKNLSDCDDTQVMLRALTKRPHTIDIMAAGTAMRFLTAYLSVSPGEHIITGTSRMKNRPIGLLVDALRGIGANILYTEKEGYPPLHITGGLKDGGHVSLPGSVSSQFISALMMIGPMLKEGLHITLTEGLISKPYIEMTRHIMEQFGAQVQWNSENKLFVAPTGYTPQPYFVESDWSAASYWYQMVALSADEGACIDLIGLFEDSLQGDAAVRAFFEPLGVSTRFYTNKEGLSCVQLTKSQTKVQRMDADFTNQPDLAQTLVATCCALNIPFRFTGLQSLKIKETDRSAALCCELGKLGFKLYEESDSVLRWDGERVEQPSFAALDTYEDHRMAMALAPLSLRLGTLTMNNPQVVSKSYPSFWEHLKNAGYQIEEIC